MSWRPSVDHAGQTFLRIARPTMNRSVKTLVAVLLAAAGGAGQADDTVPAPAGTAVAAKKPAPGKKATNRNVGSAPAKPFLAGERPRNAFDVPLLRDAGSLPSLTAPAPNSQRWNWSANTVPDSYVRPL